MFLMIIYVNGDYISENVDGGAEEPFEIDYDRYLVMMNLIG